MKLAAEAAAWGVKATEEKRKREAILKQCRAAGHAWSDWRSERWGPMPNLLDDDYQETMKIATSGYRFSRYDTRCGERVEKTAPKE